MTSKISYAVGNCQNSTLDRRVTQVCSRDAQIDRRLIAEHGIK